MKLKALKPIIACAALAGCGPEIGGPYGSLHESHFSNPYSCKVEDYTHNTGWEQKKVFQKCTA